MGRRGATLALALFLGVAALFLPAVDAEFLNYDDDQYVTHNPRVAAGLTWKGLSWAFTSVGYAFNWHPLTWLSHMADVGMFGMDPRGHHLMNVLLHSVNGVLLLLLLRGLTGALWPSALAAALFVVHPLHVESVAWVSERKDLLSTLFALLALAAYLRHLRRPGRWGLLPAMACFVLGLAAKPMLVGIPALLLVLDYWPLGRFRRPQVGPVVEKLPFLAIAGAAGAVTYLAQLKGGALRGMEDFSLPVRAANAATAYVWYAVKALWPAGLTVFYPYPDPEGASFWWRALGATLSVALVTVLALWAARARPYLLAGWLWFLTTLLPVIGIVQAGLQAVADRYTYLPLVGLFVAVAWGAAQAARRRPQTRTLLSVFCALALAAFASTARLQLGHWRSSVALFEHALTVTDDNYIAEFNLGLALERTGRLEEANRHYLNWARLKGARGQGHP